MSALFAIALALAGATPQQVQALVEDGRLDEAAEALSDLPEALRPRFEGLIALERGAPAAAATAFERALTAEDAQPELQLYLAHAYVLTKRYAEALTAARAAAPLADRLLAQPLIEARARRGLGDLAGAHAVLERAVVTFADQARPRLELVVLLSEAGLRRAARAAADPMLALPPEQLDAPTALALFHVLYVDPDALPLLEALTARFPQDPELRGHLGHAYAAVDRGFAAGRLFEQATLLGGDYAFEAADQYRVVGRFGDALRICARVKDKGRRRKQRLSIAFDQRRYARVIGLASAAQEPADAYRVAYAHYALGQLAKAADLARALRGTSYEGQGAALLDAMGRRREVE